MQDDRIKSDKYTAEQLVSVYQGLFTHEPNAPPATDEQIAMYVKHAEKTLKENAR